MALTSGDLEVVGNLVLYLLRLVFGDTVSSASFCIFLIELIYFMGPNLFYSFDVIL